MTCEHRFDTIYRRPWWRAFRKTKMLRCYRCGLRLVEE